MSTNDDFQEDRVAVIHEGLQHLGPGFAIFDRDFRLAAWNRRYLELFDVPEDMLTHGRPLSDLLRIHAIRGVYGSGDIDEQVEQIMKVATIPKPYCYERPLPNGTVIEIRGQPLPSGGFVAIYTDITERKLWENDLQEAKLAAEEANQAKSDILNIVSHDLRTPLTAVRSFAEILRDNPELDVRERAHFFSVIDSECQRLIRMTNDLLDFAKIEAGRMDWSITELDPVSLVESAAASVAPMFQEKHVDFVLDLPPEAPPVVGDPDRLTEVIINLLSNAQKFVPENKGRVCVSMDVGQSEVTISVADDGRGIPLEKQDEIFQAFRQVVSEDGSHPSGTGLGLAISKKIVNHLGGRIWVDSTPHEGATFRFSVPLRH